MPLLLNSVFMLVAFCHKILATNSLRRRWVSEKPEQSRAVPLHWLDVTVAPIISQILRWNQSSAERERGGHSFSHSRAGQCDSVTETSYLSPLTITYHRPVIKITLETGIGSDRVTRQCSYTDNPPNHRTTCFIVNITPTSGRSLEI